MTCPSGPSGPSDPSDPPDPPATAPPHRSTDGRRAARAPPAEAPCHHPPPPARRPPAARCHGSCPQPTPVPPPTPPSRSPPDPASPTAPAAALRPTTLATPSRLARHDLPAQPPRRTAIDHPRHPAAALPPAPSPAAPPPLAPPPGPPSRPPLRRGPVALPPASGSFNGSVVFNSERAYGCKSLKALFSYDKPIPEEIINKPIGVDLSDKHIGDNPPCMDCQVKGAVLCATCAGTGLYVDSIMESQGIIVKVRCLGCGGAGNIMCSECGGRGHL